MKIKLLLIISFGLLLNVNYSFSQKLELNPIVDERVELLSIVFRLAGADEYLNNSMENYTKSIDEYFKPYANDEVIVYAKKLRKKRAVAYDAVMSMAIHIEITNGCIKLIENVIENNIDDRWGKHSEKFVEQLNKFYQKSNFHKFFLSNKDLYSIAENRFSEISKTMDVPWFKSFFGQSPNGTYNIVLSLVNMGNYGPKIDYQNGKTDIYSIICAWETDSLALPVYSSNVTNTIVHEFCHSFCNPLGEKYFADMRTVADDFYKTVANQMKKQAYGNSQTMINEILVRASTIKYFQNHDATDKDIQRFIRYEQANGFIWIEPLLNALAEYENDRTNYPTLEKFMPEIIKLHNSLSPEKLAATLEENSPKIVSFSIENNSQNIDPNTKEIIVVYDRPMSSRGISVGKGGKKTYPKITSVEWRNDNRTEMIIFVELEPNKEYSLKFHEQFNQDKYGFVLDKTYELNFKTKE